MKKSKKDQPKRNREILVKADVTGILALQTKHKVRIFNYGDESESEIIKKKVINLIEKCFEEHGITDGYFTDGYETHWKGITNINGVEVSITTREGYTTSAIIQFHEKSSYSYANEEKIMEYLIAHGIANSECERMKTHKCAE